MDKKIYKPPILALYTILLTLWLAPVCAFATENIEMFETGNVLLDQAAYNEALNVYQSFINTHPEHRLVPPTLWTMGNIYMTIQKDYDKAIACFQTIVDKNIDSEWTMYSYERLAGCHEEQEAWQNAIDVYKPAILMLAEHRDDLQVQGQINIFRQRMLDCYRNLQDYKSIIQVYENVLSEEPAAESAPEYQFNLAQTYQEINELRAAVENYIKLVERYPFSPYAQRVQDEKSELLEEQLQYDWNIYSTFQTALNSGVTGDFYQAESLFDHIIKAKHDTPMASAARFQKDMLDFRETGDAALLIKTINETRDQYPLGYGGIPVNRLIPMLEQVAELREDVAENPDVGTYGAMAIRYYQLRAYLCGADAYKKAIAIEPENKTLYNMLGYCYIGAHDFENAHSALQQLIDMDPDDPNSYDSKAEAYYSSGDIDNAIKFYQKSISMDSTFSNPYFMLGRIYSEQGDNDKAIQYLKQYLLLDADGFQAQTAQQILENLQQSDMDEK